MFPLAFITDEATQDLHEAIDIARAHGVLGLELRSIDDTPIDEISTDRLARYAEAIREAGLTVPCLAGSFFKDVLRVDVVARELEKLERLLDAADIFGCRAIRGFAGLKDPDHPQTLEALTTCFEPVTRRLRERGKMLLLEADPHVNTTNHRRLADLLKLLDPAYYGAIYDPGNSLYDPEGERPFPDGYDALRGRIRHVHIKDVTYDDDGKPYCLKIGDGDVPFPDVLAALARDGYEGYLSLETHYRKDSRLSDAQMLHPRGDAFSAGGRSAMEESLDSVRTMLRDLDAKAR